jgi:hypothetical protein
MRSLTELPLDALQEAHRAAGTLIGHKPYLPGGLLLLLLSRFRDDIREALSMEPGDVPRRGRERRSLDELTSVELSTVSGAAMILLQNRFTQVMDDPELPKLLAAYQDDLNVQKAEREQIKASMAS